MKSAATVKNGRLVRVSLNMFINYGCNYIKDEYLKDEDVFY